MSTETVVLGENLLNEIAYSGHTLTGNTEENNKQAWRVADGRRASLDYWTPTGTNAIAYLDLVCDRVRGANMVVIDRGHNLEGHEVEIRGTHQSAWTTFDTVASVTVPSAKATGALDDANGVITPEGAWLKRFPLGMYRYWRVYVPAMGVGLRPEIVGCWLGKTYEIDHVERTAADTGARLFGRESVADGGWRAQAPAVFGRSGRLEIKLRSQVEQLEAELTLNGHFAMGRPTWLVLNADAGHRAVCIRREPGDPIGFRLERDYGWPQTSLTWYEHEPKRV